MDDDLENLRSLAITGAEAASDLRALDALRVNMLGKSGIVTNLLKELGRTAPDQRRIRGAALNDLKDEISAAIEARRLALEAAAVEARLAAERMDVSLPPIHTYIHCRRCWRSELFYL